MSSKKKALTSSISSQESAASVSDLSEQTPLFGRLPFASASLTPKPSLKSTGLKSPSSTMSEHYKQIDLEELTSSQGDTPANHSALQGNNSERKMTAISGRKWLGLFDNATPLGCLQKMLLVTSQWASTKCYLTWKAKATPQGRLLFQLAPLMRRTDATGSSFWRTPDTGEGGTSGLLKEGKTHRENGQPIQVRLVDQVNSPHLWPTPTTQDAANNGGKSQYERNSLPLNAAVGGSLNPEFVEWLMGFQIGWTDLKD